METKTEVRIPLLRKSRFSVTIIGETSLLCHRFSEKSKGDIEDTQGKKAKKPKGTPRDPEAEFKASLYPMNNGKEGVFGFPVGGIKKAMVTAALDLTDARMAAQTRRAFHILAEDGSLVEIQGMPEMRTDTVRLNGRSADLRYRAEFKQWQITFEILHNPDLRSEEELINLLQHAGFGVGLGDSRPEKKGSFGMFKIKEA